MRQYNDRIWAAGASSKDLERFGKQLRGNVFCGSVGGAGPTRIIESLSPWRSNQIIRKRRRTSSPSTTSKDPIEQQILAAGNLSEAQVEAIRGFQRRKGLTFGEAAIALGLVRRDSLFLALSKRYNYPVLNFGVDEGRFSRELVVGYQPFSTAAEAFRSVRSALATGPLSQGKNAFAVIGPPSQGRSDLFRRQSCVVFRPDGGSNAPCRRKLEEA